jgi:hypothetical protein
MYDVRPNLVLGFHGCDEVVCNALLNNPNDIRISKEPFDWLGHGMYFWENNYERAWDWAKEKYKRGQINKPAVIGAIIYLGRCCDFLDAKHLDMLRVYYELMKMDYNESGESMPENEDVPKDKHKDKVLRKLDCGVIESMHSKMYDQIKSDISDKGYSHYKPMDSVRGAFIEGGPVFEGSMIYEKTHIQICIRNPNCIKGFFLPREKTDFIQQERGYIYRQEFAPSALLQ